jgi:cytochrome c oxidase subunit 2
MKLRILVPTLVLALAAPTVVAARYAGGAGAPQRVTIDAKRFVFIPSEFTVKKGEPVTLVLTDEDVAHGIKFAEFNVNLKGAKGQTKEITFTPAVAGDFVGQCSNFCGKGHGDMKLTMHVTE